MFIVDYTNKLVIDGVRPSFKNEVINNARFSNYVSGLTDYCHSISAGVMQAWIYEIIMNTGINDSQKANDLQNIAIALRTPPEVNAANLPPTQKENEIINNLCNARKVDKQANYANQLYIEFFNEINNLRVGSEQWNRAIQENYDPTIWIHIDGNGNVDFFNNTPIIPANVPQNKKSCFFLTNDQDNRRISNIINIHNVTTPICILSNQGYSQGNPIQYIYSSDNDLWIDPARDLTPGDPIYFFNYNENQWTQF